MWPKSTVKASHQTPKWPMSKTVRSPGSVRTIVLRSYRRSGTSFPFSSGTLIPCGLGLFPRPTQNFASVRNAKFSHSSLKLCFASSGLCICTCVWEPHLHLMLCISEIFYFAFFAEYLGVKSGIRDRLAWRVFRDFSLVPQGRRCDSTSNYCVTLWQYLKLRYNTVTVPQTAV